MVERFLDGLSNQYAKLKESINPEYTIDLASNHLTRVKLKAHCQEIQEALEINDLTEADLKAKSYSRIEIGSSAGINPLEDMEAFQKAFEAKADPLIVFPDGLGEFYDDALERDGFIAFMGPEKSGKCVAGNMRVVLADGSVRTIGKIVRDKIKTPALSLNQNSMKLEQHEVAKFWDNGVKECWQVTTRTGRTITTTANHKYLTPDGWKNLEDVKVGDFIAVPKSIPAFGASRVNLDEIRFLAFLLAEGGCTASQITFTNTDSEIISLFERTCDNLGIEFTYRNKNPLYCGYHALRQTTNLIRRLGGLEGRSSKTKFIPQWVFTAPKDQVADFLRIFFSCDGYISTTKHNQRIIGMTLANRKMLKQISHLLLRFGIVHRFSKRVAKCNNKEFPAWRVTISGREFVNLFLEEINFLSYKRADPDYTERAEKSFLDKMPYQIADRLYQRLKFAHSKEQGGKGFYAFFGKKRAQAIRWQIGKELPIMKQSFAHVKNDPIVRSYLDSDVLWDQVVSVSSVGMKQTYDLGVLPHHNFVANDCIVHNSWELMDVVYHAVLQRKKVAYFEVGDMSQDQVMRRLAVRLARRPIKPQTVLWPRSMELEKDEDTGRMIAHIEQEELKFDTGLSWQDAWKAAQKFKQKKTRTNDVLLKLSCHPNSSINVYGIQNMLSLWERDGWVPDVIVVDYADILAPMNGAAESRDQINATWKALRALSQSMHCLVVTATQSKATSYNVETMTKGEFAEDKRKLAHVTGMIGINSNQQERELGVVRLNWIVRREEMYSDRWCCHVARCLALANPSVRSIYRVKGDE
jgi:intein/homing endonuclease